VTRRTRAAIASAVFFALAPGVVAGVVPRYVTGWQTRTPTAHWWIAQSAGVVLIIAAAAVLVYAFTNFVAQGIGTPSPIAPTEQLVVSGLYRHVRNPMYLAVVSIIAGQALVLGNATLVLYGTLVGAGMAAFARWYEEPTLERRFGERYSMYRRAVPAWRPRVRPFHADVTSAND
jgi:protein-S-isoprenylcysteine O-methyltransferase Ste14